MRSIGGQLTNPTVISTRAIPAPRQDGCRVVVLGLVLFQDHVALHAVVQAEAEDIEQPSWELDHSDMFGLTDNLGTEYTVRNGGCFVDPGRHLRDWSVTIDPAAPEGATEFTVTHIDGSVHLSL